MSRTSRSGGCPGVSWSCWLTCFVWSLGLSLFPAVSSTFVVSQALVSVLQQRADDRCAKIFIDSLRNG